MQASVSGLFVHIEHEVQYGTTLRIAEARKLFAELGAAIGQVETGILEASVTTIPSTGEVVDSGQVGTDTTGEDTEKSAEAKQSAPAKAAESSDDESPSSPKNTSKKPAAKAKSVSKTPATKRKAKA